jgi:putative endonuclease
VTGPGRQVLDTATPGTQWWVYLLRCVDGSLYCGVSTDLARRLGEHNASPRGARYTRSRRPVLLAWCQPCASRAEAQRVEAAVKRQPRALKRMLCGDDPS